MTVLQYSTALARTWRKRVRVVPLLWTLAALPFTAAGWVGGMCAVGYHLALAAVRMGYADARGRYPNAR